MSLLSCDSSFFGPLSQISARLTLYCEDSVPPDRMQSPQGDEIGPLALGSFATTGEEISPLKFDI